MANRSVNTFGSGDIRAYITNSRLNTFDYNSELIRLDLSNNVVPILQDICGNIDDSNTFLDAIESHLYDMSYSANRLLVYDASVAAALSNINFNGAVTVSGPISIAPNQYVGITGPVSISGNFNVAVNAVEISGNVNLAPGTLVGITGPVSVSVNNFPTYFSVSGPVGITGPVSVSVNNFPTYFSVSGPVGITGPVSVSVNNFPSAFSVSGPVAISTMPAIDISGITGINGKLPTYDASVNYSINNHSIKAMIDDGTSTFVLSDVQGNINNVGLNSISVYNYDLDTKLTSDPGVTAAIQTTVKNTVDISGGVNIRNGITGTVGITGTALVKDVSANVTLLTIESDISGGVLVKGQDDTGARYPLYVDADGIQRTEIVPGHIESAIYIFETDIASLAPVGTAAWSLDARGRPGWYFGFGTSAVNTSLSWYKNNGISFPPAINFGNVQAIYAVITCDITFLSLPTLKVTTSASVWEYSITGTVYNGNTYLFYFGSKAVNLNPQYHPQQFTRTQLSGPGSNSELVTSITLEATSSTGQFLVNKVGIWDQPNQIRFETAFSTDKPIRAEDNLATLSFDTSDNLKVIVQNTPTVNIAAGQFVGVTGLAKIADSSGNSITSTAIANSSFSTNLLNVNPINKIRPAGAKGNVLNLASITSYNITSAVSILDAAGERIYGRNSIMAYEDTSGTSTNELCIFGVDGAGSYIPIVPSMLPVPTTVVGTGALAGRYWSSTIDLGPFVSLSVKNLGSGSLTSTLSVYTSSAYSN